MIPRFGGVRLSGESSWSVVPPMDPEIQRFGGLGLIVEWSESVMPPLLMDEPKEKRKMFATFSKGYPVFEWELWGYFNRMFGGCLATVWSPSLCRQACVDAKVYPESLRTTLIFPVVFPVADPEIKLSGEEEAKFGWCLVEGRGETAEARGGRWTGGCTVASAQRHGLASGDGAMQRRKRTGRWRNMEDAVAIHPRFCRTNRDNDNELHYFAVYEGHGCSQELNLEPKPEREREQERSRGGAKS
nr:uncharacterized protein LOC109160698 isoform X1 [Ipomoea trifida]